MFIEQLKERMGGTWSAGDFGEIARCSAQGAEEFVERLNIQLDGKVLDVACGKGNLALPAARRRAEARELDIAPNLVAQAKERAESEGLNIGFDEGIAEQMPYQEASFE